MGKATMAEVFQRIDGERSYQVKKWGDEPTPTVTEWLVFLQDYLTEAVHIAARSDMNKPDADWIGESPKTAVLNIMRKIGAMAAACMEAHGAPARAGHDGRDLWGGAPAFLQLQMEDMSARLKKAQAELEQSQQLAKDLAAERDAYAAEIKQAVGDAKPYCSTGEQYDGLVAMMRGLVQRFSSKKHQLEEAWSALGITPGSGTFTMARTIKNLIEKNGVLLKIEQQVNANLQSKLLELDTTRQLNQSVADRRIAELQKTNATHEEAIRRYHETISEAWSATGMEGRMIPLPEAILQLYNSSAGHTSALQRIAELEAYIEKAWAATKVPVQGMVCLDEVIAEMRQTRDEYCSRTFQARNALSDLRRKMETAIEAAIEAGLKS